jgi:hypothetical protein
VRSLTSGAPTIRAGLRGWSTRRWLVATVVTVAVYSGLAVASGLWSATPEDSVSNLGVAAPWWAYAIALAGAVLIGLIVVGYVGAPHGAEATFCDLRWPIIGTIGVAVAIDSPAHRSILSDLFGISGTVSSITQPILGVAALALMVWALHGRVWRERAALTAAAIAALDPHADPSPGAACTTCQPLFPPTSRRKTNP